MTTTQVNDINADEDEEVEIDVEVEENEVPTEPRIFRKAKGRAHYEDTTGRTFCRKDIVDGFELVDTDNTNGVVMCIACLNEVEARARRAEEPEVEARPAREPRQPKQPEPCLCGCGDNAKVGSKFLPGHDAKLKSILTKNEARKQADETGEEVNGVKPGQEVPEIPAVALTILVACACCGALILPHESGMGPMCRRGICRCSANSE